MIQAGVLNDDDPVELLEGVLVFKMPKNPPHTFVVEAAAEIVRAMLGPDWFYRIQEPVTLEDGEPEPDGVVIRGSRNDYRTRHPGPGDIGLVIEVSDTTLARDRGMKLRGYARAGVPLYWIINLVDRCIEACARPDAAQAEGVYLDRQVFLESDSIPLLIDGAILGNISVRDLLP